jgi:hypothetical protein
MNRLMIVLTITMALLVLTSCFPGSGPKVPKSLLIDDTHSNYSEEFEPSKRYETLVQEFKGKGYTVDLASEEGFSPENYGVVLLATPGDTFSAEEIADLSALLSRGGKIIVLGEWFEYYDNTILNALLSALGTDIQLVNNVLLDEENNYDSADQWITTEQFSTHRVAQGLTKIALFAACSLEVGAAATVIANAESTAFSLAREDVQVFSSADLSVSSNSLQLGQNTTFPVIASQSMGSGKILVIGDSEVIGDDLEEPKSGKFVDALDNLKLLRNIIDW